MTVIIQRDAEGNNFSPLSEVDADCIYEEHTTWGGEVHSMHDIVHMPALPYYEQDGIAIYHGDCIDFIGSVEVDVVVTDPPYGVNIGVANNQVKDATHLAKRAYLSFDDTYEAFVESVVPRLNRWIEIAKRAAVFTGPNIHEQKKPVAIGGIYHPSAVGRTPWGSKNLLPVLFYGNPVKPGLHRPTVLRSTATAEKSIHNCPKPLEWMRWLVGIASDESDVVVDPFMGSGTTLVAAKLEGRRAIGFEIEERYCEAAAKRLSQGTLF